MQLEKPTSKVSQRKITSIAADAVSSNQFDTSILFVPTAGIITSQQKLMRWNHLIRDQPPAPSVTVAVEFHTIERIFQNSYILIFYSRPFQSHIIHFNYIFILYFSFLLVSSTDSASSRELGLRRGEDL